MTSRVDVEERRRLSDEEILERVGRGDHGAFSSLYDRLLVSSSRYARSLVGSRAEVEDLVQEAFVKLFEHARRGEFCPRKGTGRALLWRILRNLCLDRLRIRGREVPLDEGAEPREVDANRSRESLDRGFVERLQREVHGLPEKHRQALLLRVRDGLAYQAIADELGSSLAQVKTWIFRARRELRSRLSKGRGGE